MSKKKKCDQEITKFCAKMRVIKNGILYLNENELINRLFFKTKFMVFEFRKNYCSIAVIHVSAVNIFLSVTNKNGGIILSPRPVRGFWIKLCIGKQHSNILLRVGVIREILI